MWKKQNTHSSLSPVRKTISLFTYQNLKSTTMKHREKNLSSFLGFIRPTLNMERIHKIY